MSASEIWTGDIWHYADKKLQLYHWAMAHWLWKFDFFSKYTELGNSLHCPTFILLLVCFYQFPLIMLSKNFRYSKQILFLLLHWIQEKHF
jgi:hypothetical protein